MQSLPRPILSAPFPWVVLAVCLFPSAAWAHGNYGGVMYAIGGIALASAIQFGLSVWLLQTILKLRKAADEGLKTRCLRLSIFHLVVAVGLLPIIPIGGGDAWKVVFASIPVGVLGAWGFLTQKASG